MDEAELEAFEERAAIGEHDGGLTLEEAEAQAEAEVQAARAKAKARAKPGQK